MANTDLKTYSFTDEDINLLTHSLRRLIKNARSKLIIDEAKDLLAHIERMKKEKENGK